MTFRYLLAATLLAAFIGAPRMASAQTEPEPWGEPAGEPTDAPPPTDDFATDPGPADDGSYPTNFAQRPLTLPALNLRADLAVSLLHLDFGFGDDTFTAIGAGAGFGVLDDLEVGLGQSPIAPIQPYIFGTSSQLGLGGVVAPDGARGFTPPRFYGRYRFLGGEPGSLAELGAELAFLLPTEYSDFGIDLGMPMRFHFGEMFALGVGVGFLVVFSEDAAGNSDAFYGLQLNLQPRFAMDFFYAGMDTGFSMDPENPDGTTMPLTFEVGGTFGIGSSMVVDAFVSGGLPYFLVPGNDGDKVISEIWQIQFGGRAHFDFSG